MMNKRKRIVVSVFIILIAGLGLLEIGAALILKDRGSGLSPTAQRHLYATYRGHKLNPSYRHEKDTNNLLLHGSDGFRGVDTVVIKKPENVFRIIMFGGSAMYGLGVYADRYEYQPALSNNETIDYFLHFELTKRFEGALDGKEIEVLNAGVTAYQTFQHLVHYNERLHQYSPDLVLFLDGHNDFYITSADHNHWLDYNYISTFLSEPFNQRLVSLALYSGVRVVAPYSYFFTLCEKYFARHLAGQYRVSRQSDQRKNFMTSEESILVNYPRVAHNTFLRVYAQFKELSTFDDFKWLVMLQPEVVFERDADLSAQDMETKTTTEKSYGKMRVERMKAVRALLPEIFRTSNIPFVDLGAIGDPSLKSQKLYGDHVHLSPAGAKRVASLIADQVDRRGFIQSWLSQDVDNN